MAPPKSKVELAEYATLYLARAIAEGSLPMARAAVEAGADLNAFWIDGKTKLRDLASRRRLHSLDAYFKEVLSPEATRKLPEYKPQGGEGADQRPWSRTFVEFAAKRGYLFLGKSILKGGIPGSDMPPFRAKAALNLIESKWNLVKSVRTYDEGEASSWSIEFDFDFNADRRIPGIELRFKVDSPGWDLLRMFRDSDQTGAWPDDVDSLLDRQKVWDGNLIMDPLLEDSAYSLDKVIAKLRRGGNPFYTWQGTKIGEFDEADERIKPFMDRLRSLCGPELGFHRRIGALLTKSGVEALASGAELEASIPSPKARRKSLAEGRANVL